ncbi:hypothetical protein SLE2022_112260 [Rubroshorea leprosula]
MDWCFGSGIDDLVVPKDQELSDRFPTPESWPKWEINAPGNMESQNECFILNTNFAQEYLVLSGKSLYNEVEMESPISAEDESCSSVCGGSSQESLNQAPISHRQLDYQLDELSRFQQMDDIFLNSLLEDLPGSEDSVKSYSHSPDSQCDMMPTDNLLGDMFSNCQSISSNQQSVGSSKYLKTNAFSPTQSLQKVEVPPLYSSPSTLEKNNSLTLKVPPANDSLPPEKSCIDENITPGPSSLEEFILQELESVMTQLPHKTRICFRDALFRLAKNSQQNLVARNQRRSFSLETEFPTHDAKIRSERKNGVESETNTIDIVIASFTLNKMEVNFQDFPVLKHRFTKAREALKHSSNQSEIHFFPQSSVMPRDVEVPNVFWQHAVTNGNRLT